MHSVLRHLLTVALCAGLLSGLVATAAHQIGTVPAILGAEVFETAATAHADHATHAASWEPENGVERTLYTLAADILTAIGYALLLCAGFALRGGDMTWRHGLFWGLAGFAAFTLAPSLGLPPELPGATAAPLLDRQIWWLATVLATGCGIGLLAFTRRPVWSLLAILLIVLPHIWGAPHPADYATTAPQALTRQFAAGTMVSSFLFWTTLGAASGYFYHRFASPRPSAIHSESWS